MSSTNLTWMVPAVTCTRKRKTARDTLRSSNLETISSSVQGIVMFLVFAVMMQEKGGEELGNRETKGCFVPNWKNTADLRHSIGLGLRA